MMKRKTASFVAAGPATALFGLYRHVSRDFVVLSGFLLLLFMTGGGSRADMLSLVIIRPVAAILAVWWTMRLSRTQINEFRALLLFAVAAIALVGLYLVPLPPSVWQALPGHQIIAEIDRTVGLRDVWRPASIAPDATRNALFALLVPFAVLVGLIHLSSEERRGLVPLVIAIGGVSLAFSLAQDAAPAASSLWLYRVTNSGEPVGLFANRNHSAVFLACLLPLCTVWAFNPSRPRRAALRKALAAGVCALVAVAVLVTGSRAGLVALGMTLAGSLLLLPRPPLAQGRGRWSRLYRPLQIAALVATLVIAALGTAYLLRQGSGQGGSETIDRVTTTNADEARLQFWRRTIDLVPDYLPLGSGPGSFVEAYQLDEPERAVGSQYVNHAHNDYLEIALTLGVPGIVLLASMLVYLLVHIARVWRLPAEGRRNVPLARAASLVFAILVIASAADYPARVPSIAAFAVLLSAWLVQAGSGSLASRSSLAFTK